jgi:hypothetical protein
MLLANPETNSALLLALLLIPDRYSAGYREKHPVNW